MANPSSTIDSGLQVARLLLQAGCVSVRTDEPFRLPSGWASPVYIDCRRVISYPSVRRQLVSLGLATLRAKACLQGIDSIVGGEASGIALAAWLAHELDLPLQYVRKKAAGHSQIEGHLPTASTVLLVDDVMAGGLSKLNFCRALRAAQCTVRHIFVLFEYGCFPTDELLQPWGLQVHALSNWHNMAQAMEETHSYAPQALRELHSFLADAPQWSHRHGGIAAYHHSPKPPAP